jgi:hypothetical protein
MSRWLCVRLCVANDVEIAHIVTLMNNATRAAKLNSIYCNRCILTFKSCCVICVSKLSSVRAVYVSIAHEC